MSPPSDFSSDQPIIVSACLLGHRCRYNAVVRRSERIVATENVVPVCPEVLGSLSTPRPAADIDAGCDGGDVIDGLARVTDTDGNDVTDSFVKGAREALRIVQSSGARRALLKTRSPSCGCGELSRSDGTRTPGNGVFAELLQRSGIEVEGADFDREGSGPTTVDPSSNRTPPADEATELEELS